MHEDATNCIVWFKILLLKFCSPILRLSIIECVQVKAEGRGTKKWSRRRGLEEQRFYDMTKLKTQFKDLLKVQ